MSGAALVAYATYVPHWRLPSGRPVASFDEDSTTMAVQAAARLRYALDRGPSPEELWFATSSPAYLDKTNATAVHAALRLAPQVPASDLIGTARSTMSAVRSAIRGGGLVLAADIRVGRPGSVDERGGADAAGALLFAEPTAERPAIADVLATASVTDEFLDRWRIPGEPAAHQWEERFGLERYGRLIRAAADRALAAAGLESPDRVVVAGANSGVVKRATSLVSASVGAGNSGIGTAGAVDPVLALARALDEASPGETVLLLSACDGCDAVLMRVTDAIAHARQRTPLMDQAGSGRDVDYMTYLSWRGLLELEPPRRPAPDRPAAPPSGRNARWKFGLIGGRCDACGFLHLPPARVCRRCGGRDAMTDVSVAELSGRVATYTVDRLAYSPSPPVVNVVVDFGRGEGDGRSTFEVADADPQAISVGTGVEMVFRRLFTAGDVHDYFWKARTVEGTHE